MEIDEHAVTVSGDMLHIWNDPSVGMLHTEIVVQIARGDEVISFSVYCKDSADTETLFKMLQQSYIVGIEVTVQEEREQVD